MITSYLADEIMRQRAAEARELGERHRLAAVAKKAARERRHAAKSVAHGTPVPNGTPAGNAEQGAVMSC